nr:MAG TPA: hypothetical protein [Caudoviricetes sp.]
MQTPLFAFSCTCGVGFLTVACAGGLCNQSAFAILIVSSHRGDARQGRGVICLP